MGNHGTFQSAQVTKLLAATTFSLLGWTIAPPAGAQHADTARSVVVNGGRVVGRFLEWRAGDTIRSTFEYNDRGRGPHLESRIRVGPDSIPDLLAIVGHGYLKDTVDERFFRDGPTSRWKSSAFAGSARSSVRALYADATESPAGNRLMIKAALANGGRVPLLPSGTLTVEPRGKLTIQTTAGPVHVTLYDVGGLGLSPYQGWLDENGSRFALVSSWTSIVPEGWERAIPEMVATQDRAGEARYVRLARTLTHRPAGGALAITNARLFVAESATVRPRTTVLMRGNRIIAVGSDGAVAIPPGAQRIDAAGKLLLPGLWDMHVHLVPGDDGLLDIAAGVTTVRDMGNDTVGTLVARRRYGADSLIGPRMILAGLIDSPGPYQVPTGVLADDSASVLRDVRWFKDHDYEQIKVYSSMKPELVPLIIASAHAAGMRVSGHVPAFMTAEQVVRLGFDEVQHANMLMLNFLDSVRDTRTMARFTEVGAHARELDFSSARVRDFVSLFKARGVDIDPTLVAFEDMFTARPGTTAPSIAEVVDRMPAAVQRVFLQGGLPVTPATDRQYRESWLAMMRMVKTMNDAGVSIVAGTDAYPAGFALHRELELYVAAGIPAPEVLRFATIGAARTMHHDDDRGSIVVGKLADLVLVDGDATVRISDIRRTALVVKDGLIYRPSELYAALSIRP